MCVFAVPIYFHFFPLAFVLVNDLSLVSRCSVFVLEMLTILFLLPFVSFCCMHLYFMFTAVSYQMFFHGVSEINHLTCSILSAPAAVVHSLAV